MKITRVQTIVLNLPMLIDGATPMLGGRARTSIDMLLVRVDTDGGVTGWGEAFGHRIFPATRATIDTLLGPWCVGRDPSQIAQLNDEIQRSLHGIGRSGPALPVTYLRPAQGRTLCGKTLDWVEAVRRWPRRRGSARLPRRGVVLAS